MAGQNGNNAAMYAGINGAIVPSAGHFSDMQTLMQNMETLSGWLQQNREDWVQVQDGLARVERLHGRVANGSGRDAHLPLQNGDALPASDFHDFALQPAPQDETESTASLQTALTQTQQRLTALEKTYTDQLRIQSLYEDTLADATERIRNYCHSQAEYVASLHTHYTSLLEQSRMETIEAQVTHQQWQAGLKRLSEGVRGALKSREEEGLPWKGRVRGLEEENRVLRKMVGWDPPPPAVDSEDEGDEEGLDAIRGRDGRGRSIGFERMGAEGMGVP